MRKKLVKLTLLLALAAAFIWTQNEWIQTTQLTYASADLPTAFDGTKILQISDLHNHRFGANQKHLIKAIENAAPDLVVVTGDLIDRRRYNLDPIHELLADFPDLPVYYVSGNHEAWSGRYPEVRNLLASAGWHILDNETAIVERDDQSIQLVGLMDPATRDQGDIETHITNHLKKIMFQEDGFTVLLAHRPNPLETYAKYPVDFAFTGHAHGGQFRIPFVGGLIAPEQGLFPEYTSGMHTIDQTTMVVSRGLGNSIVPIRLFNRPELILVTLKRK